MSLFHIVLISFRSDTPEGTRQKVFNAFQSLAGECGGKGAGIQHFEVAHNLDLRKNVHLVETAVFEDSEALQRFRGHPAHTALTDTLRECADWQVGDFHTNIFDDIFEK